MKTLSLYLIVIIALTSALFAQEIPNGDGDLLWERGLNGRSVNDAKFHPINGNIIAAVNHEIWEIDPKDGHTIRVFEGGYPADANDAIETINITSDGQKIVTGGAMGLKGILIWDYNTGMVTKIITLNEVFDVYENVGIYPDNNRIIFNTYVNNYGFPSNVIKFNVYDLQLNKVVKSINKQDTYCDKFQMSKDGNIIAYGLSYGTPGDWKNTMELWDAETLTKIKDFGEAGDIVEFRDVQISDDNQYIGFLCGGPRIMYLFNTDNSQFIKNFNNITAFSFTPNTKIILYSGTKPEDAQTNILSLPKLDTLYQYIWARSIFRFNESNEMYAGAGTMKLYSSRWYEVGVNEPFDKKFGANYEKDQLIITLPKEVIPKKISIMNLLGEIVYQTTELTELNGKIVLDLPLPSGIYFISLNDGKSKLFGKFVVVR